MFGIEAMYAGGVNPEDIENLTEYGRRYPENLDYLRRGIVDEFRQIIDRNFKRLRQQIGIECE